MNSMAGIDKFFLRALHRGAQILKFPDACIRLMMYNIPS